MFASVRRGTALANPFDTLWDVQREVNRLFENASRPANVASTLPAEVVESDSDVRIMIEIPGMDPADIELTVENNVLTVCGEKRWQKEEGTAENDYHLMERRYGRFARGFTLPSRVNAGAIDASYDKGILTVRLPKSEEAKPRRIEVRSGTEAKQIRSE